MDLSIDKAVPGKFPKLKLSPEVGFSALVTVNPAGELKLFHRDWLLSSPFLLGSRAVPISGMIQLLPGRVLLKTESQDPKISSLAGVPTGDRGERWWRGVEGVLGTVCLRAEDTGGVCWRFIVRCRMLTKSSSLSRGSCERVLCNLVRVRRTELDLSVDLLLFAGLSWPDCRWGRLGSSVKRAGLNWLDKDYQAVGNTSDVGEVPMP